MTASDGTEFTDEVTVWISIDSGEQVLGSVGSGVCVHLEHGYHVYRPATSETDGGRVHVPRGAGALTHTVHIYTRHFVVL
jgi:hypothetical protein